MGRPSSTSEVIDTRALLAEARTLATRIVTIVDVLESDLSPPEEPTDAT